MRAFAQDGLWDRLAERGALGAAHIDALVEVLCAFHARAAVAGPDAGYGRPAQVRAPMRDTLRALAGAVPRRRRARTGSTRCAAWEAQASTHCAARFASACAHGRVRECHGDLHLGNVTQIDGRTTVFDCLEFNADLRWTDVMSDVAFMAMDLHGHGLPRLAHRFVNAYVERSGDCDGPARAALLPGAPRAGARQSGRAARGAVGRSGTRPRRARRRGTPPASATCERGAGLQPPARRRC